MSTYYAVTDHNGPISVKIEAHSVDGAVSWFLDQDADFSEDARIDAEDDYGFCGAEMTSEEFAEKLESLGLRIVCRNICGNHLWDLWQV
jgi:hypothetical protein